MKATRRYAEKGLAALGLVLFGACSDSQDVAGPGGDQLTPAEAAGVSSFFVGQAFSGWDFNALGGGGGGGAALQSGAPITVDFTDAVEAACPEGGSVSVSVAIAGTIDDQTGAGDLSLDVVTSAAACGIVADGTGFTVDTNPDLTLTGDFTFADGALVGDSDLSYAGALMWFAEDGRSGSCTYDVVVTLSESGTTVANGTVCGQEL